MNPAFFLLVSAACLDPTSYACSKTSEAWLKQEKYWDYGQKFGKWANEELGTAVTTTVATAASWQKYKKFIVSFGGSPRYNGIVSQSEGSFGITWRFE